MFVKDASMITAVESNEMGILTLDKRVLVVRKRDGGKCMLLCTMRRLYCYSLRP